MLPRTWNEISLGLQKQKDLQVKNLIFYDVGGATLTLGAGVSIVTPPTKTGARKQRRIWAREEQVQQQHWKCASRLYTPSQGNLQPPATGEEKLSRSDPKTTPVGGSKSAEGATPKIWRGWNNPAHHPRP